MKENKRFYWLKMPSGFFEDKAIKKLRQIAGGDTYTIIYLKMLLKSLEDDGKFFFEGIEDNICEEIAMDINENVDDVKLTINYLVNKGLMEVSELTAEMSRIKEMTGSETASARRVRKHRMLQCNTELLQCNTDVTECNTNVTNCNTEREKDIDKEIDKEREREKDIGTPTASPAHPIFSDILGYAESLGIKDNAYCQKFYTHYEGVGWVNGLGIEIKDWKSIFHNWAIKDQKIKGETDDSSNPKKIGDGIFEL